MPICAVSYKNGKLNKNDKCYLETYKRIIGDDCVMEITDIFSGEWIGAINSKGEYVEGKFSGYNKAKKVLQYYCNGVGDRKDISQNIQAFIVYSIDILGNKYVRLDTRNIL